MRRAGTRARDQGVCRQIERTARLLEHARLEAFLSLGRRVRPQVFHRHVHRGRGVNPLQGSPTFDREARAQDLVSRDDE